VKFYMAPASEYGSGPDTRKPKPASCLGCPLWGSGKGFVPASGTGENGVLIVAEAAGENEENEGVPLVGKAGMQTFTQLKRVGLAREDFRIHNVLSCRPPDNKLAGEAWEKESISRCAPNLDATIALHKAHCERIGKTPTILTMGKIAFKRVMNYGEYTHERLLKEDYTNYPFWNEKYGCWVVAVDHPSYLMRGNHHLWPTFQFGAARAVEIAAGGLTLEKPAYLLDPDATQLKSWVEGFKEAYAQDNSIVLSYDIETPYKRGKSEEDLSKEMDNQDDYAILRIAFCYAPGVAVSGPMRQDLMPLMAELFAHPVSKLGWNSDNFDFPRVLKAFGTIGGDQLDGMLAWHVVNSAMPKGLGFVTPYYWQATGMWKHLSDAEPAFYNAKDADAALRNWLGIKRDLEKNNQWHVFDRHVVAVNKVFTHMREKGIEFDFTKRAEAEVAVATVLAEIETKIDQVVPLAARQLKKFAGVPPALRGKSDDEAQELGFVRTPGEAKVKECQNCGARGVKADHFKSIGKKRLKLGEAENPCFGSKSVAVTVEANVWARILPFKLSTKQLLSYQAVKKHKPIFDRKEKKITFNEDAINRLARKYKSDELYPLILSQRGPAKLLGTYIGRTEGGRIVGGMPVGIDGRVHTLFTHNPSTLRSASQNPNLQNLPRPSKTNPLPGYIRGFFKASPGHILYARDYSGIEAVLVGYFAGLPDYVRLAKMDVHSYYTAYAIHQLDPGRMLANDLPILSWEDDKLAKRLKEIKSAFSAERNNLYKHLVHGNNFMQGVEGSQRKIYLETGEEPEYALVKKVMDVYFGLFPGIRKWHTNLLLQASDQGYLRNPFGYVHRFNKVFDWKKEPWGWEKVNGPQANEVIAFLPQSTAAGIIKEAMLRLYFDYYDAVGEFLRLLVHDELFFEVPEKQLDAVDTIVKLEMERPVPELALPAEWGMGACLGILTEEKKGYRWSEMK
jgi:uracil-DNA glycosylase family 4